MGLKRNFGMFVFDALSSIAIDTTLLDLYFGSMTNELASKNAERIARGAALHGKLIERPAYCADEHLEYLDRLREVGICEMDDAATIAHLIGEYPELDQPVSLADQATLYRGIRAHLVLIQWHETFNARHGA